MKIAVLKEVSEPRVALVPDSIRKLVKLDEVEVLVEKDLTGMIADSEYEAAGAKVTDSRTELLGAADVLLWVNEPKGSDIGQMKKGALSISFLDPYNNQLLVRKFI